MISVREMHRSEAGRFEAIDRTEHVTRNYTYRDGELVEREVDWRVPRWPLEGGHESVAGFVDRILALLDEGGVMLGAFDGDLLVGVATLRYGLTESSAQLHGLHVSQSHRRRGVASRLLHEVERLARQSGARELYVSATPSGSAVGFYRSRGFTLAEKPHPELYALEPEDIHMTKPL